MKISFNTSQLRLFLYCMTERHMIWLKRAQGLRAPWTKDSILQTYKFTNVFRQLDRVSLEWARRYTTLLGANKKISDGDILFHCIMFRLFNWPPTYDALVFGMRKWSVSKAIEVLKRQKEEGRKIFTGAYIVTAAGRTEPKYQVIAEAVQYVYERRDELARDIVSKATMEHAVERLQEIPTVGAFVAYEIACDLRFTKLLSQAKDICSWANPGPGAKRGIHRLMTGSAQRTGPKPDYVKAMRILYLTVNGSNVIKVLTEGHDWPFELREIEHSLCEFDKYMRVKNGEGRPRSKYKGQEHD